MNINFTSDASLNLNQLNEKVKNFTHFLFIILVESENDCYLDHARGLYTGQSNLVSTM